MPKKKFTFIDLFAGLGGFHLALSQLGGVCVFASELKDDLRQLYEQNYNVDGKIVGDITKIDFNKIPKHDVLCAGFPCQPFSQAGKRQGFNDEAGRGNLFDTICEIIKAQGEDKPKYIFLENVSNLKGHDEGRTWKTIEEKLHELDYEIEDKILSPHQFGIPQHRKRIYIVGVRKDQGGIAGFEFPEITKSKRCDIHDIIDEQDTDIQPLRLETISQLKVWQAFIDKCKENNVPVPRFPIWAMEFGADYPFIDCAPALLDEDELNRYRGKLGKIISGPTLHDCVSQLPIYSQTTKAKTFPGWKIRYITQNRDFYTANKTWIDKWLPNIENYENSHMKLEWNCGESDHYDIFSNIIQFRASGIRVKLPTFSPALNLCGTQIPVLPWVELPPICIPHYTPAELEHYNLTEEDVKRGRYLSIREAAKLQGMENLNFHGLSKTRIYEALGNAVNTQVVNRIARNLLKSL